MCLLCLLVVSACAPGPIIEPLPTLVPFPTMTPGRYAVGRLPPPVGLPLDGGLFANAAAQAVAPTPTVNFARCPAPAAPTLEPPPNFGREMNGTMLRFLDAAGSAEALAEGLRSTWGVLGASGYVRADRDLTGEGTPDILVGYLQPDGGGTLLIAACADGRMIQVYDATLGGEPPQVLWMDDMTFDALPEVLFASRVCTGATDASCVYRTQLIAWRERLGRFVNLLGDPVESSRQPAIEDVDQDQVLELVVRMDDNGSAESGPRRTGIIVYDWNGGAYVRALTQLDPPRFRVQVVHQADAAFAAEAYAEAIALYQQAITSPDLRNWQNDDIPTLQNYALYRLLITYAFLEDDRLLELVQQMQTAFPDPASAPVFIQLAQTFWSALQVTNNLRSACLEADAFIAGRGDVLALLNRYGSESPTYTARDICPF